ncbi:unnamed protein product [Porites lobata]|uniref:RING-type E3 ubiquitin transferase n=1 Tax=Porites lobata TaxID=104759 RepID=A0ABN8QL56_9CNID|nr:unnamed protein product [Porites lobata]
MWLVLKDLPLEELKEKATWHRSCYQETTHSGKIKRVKERFQREVRGPNEARRKTSESLQGLLTRSKTVPYDSNLCFFCEEKAKYQNPLHLVSTSSAGSSLDNAVKQSKDPKLLVKLSTALDSTDAHAIDIKYHKSCWAKHVSGVLRKTIKDDEERSRIKELIQKEIKGVEFHKPSRANEPERVSVKQCRDAAIHIVESTADSDESMKTLFDGAQY